MRNGFVGVKESQGDWIIDIGPEGGVRGGEIVAEGTPEQVAKAKGSFTGSYLAPMLGSWARKAGCLANLISQP